MIGISQDMPAPTRPLARRPDEARPTAPGGRIAAGVLALGCFSLLAVAAYLSPSAEGHGTHEQLGLAPCSFLDSTGFPCATCGMTTAFAYAAEGDYLTSFHTQPMGMTLALLASTVFWLSLHSALTGSRIGHAASTMMSNRIAWYAIGALVLAWVYKIVTTS
jgi:hypothetical protein